jgi:hypothetical protein
MLEVAKPINNIIHNNQKIKETQAGEDTQIMQVNKEDTNDNSFNQLLALQLLIQKQSGLKDLCKIYYL